MPGRRIFDDRARIAPLWVALAAFVAFLPSIGGGFVFDDLPIIRDNPLVHGFAHAASAFSVGAWSARAQDDTVLGLGYYRPLVSVSYMLDWTLGGGRPAFFHATNIVAHAVATWLAARVLLRWVPRFWPAVICALLFALHPSRAENVAWIAGRTDVFATLFQLAALELSRWGSDHGHPIRRGAAWAAAALAAVAALLCKESAAGLPLFFAVDALMERARTPGRPVVSSPFVAAMSLSGTYLFVRHVWMPVLAESPPLTLRYGLVCTLFQAKRLLVPWPQTFFPDPIRFADGAPRLPLPLALGGVATIVAYALLCLAARRRDRGAAAALVASAALLAPLLNFVPTGIPNTTADRFLYEPLLFLTAGVARLFASGAPRVLARGWALAGAGVLLSCVGVILVRTIDFRDDFSIWRAELAVNPDNPLALRELARMAAEDGDTKVAEAYLDRALAPAATQYGQLATSWFVLTAYVHRVELYVRRTADGDIVRLEAALHELTAMTEGRMSPSPRPPSDLPQRPAIGPHTLGLLMHHPSRTSMLSAAGVLAARLGQDDQARRLLGAIPAGAEREVSNGLRVAFAWASIGDYARARAWAERARAGESPGRLIGEVERDFDAARHADFTEERATRQASALAGIGSYLRALRILRPAYDAGPRPEVARLYVQLLVFARLEKEATHAASRFAGPDAARIVDGIRAQLPPALLACRPVVEPSPWWGGPDASGLTIAR